MDRDSDGQIDVVDFEKGITRLGLTGTLSNDDIKKIFGKICSANGVNATYRTFSR